MAINLKIEDGNLSVERKKIIHTDRGRIAFSNTATDANHTIYNNYLNLDGEGAWDGMKINCYEGLDIRTGNANGIKPKSALKIDGNGLTAESGLTLNGIQPAPAGLDTVDLVIDKKTGKIYRQS